MSLTLLRPPQPSVDLEDASEELSFVAEQTKRGQGDPRWVKPALAALLAGTAVLYIWGLGSSGWANSFYSAAVEAATKSWKAFFFGSFDSSNFITVDKPPVSLWVMDFSARLFGLNSWSILIPEALEGVASVAVLYATVKRWFGARAGLLAGLVLALTPVAVLMFRFNNPDALLVLLLVAGAWATTRAIETGKTRWLVLMAVFVGTGFLTKMMQAFLVVPAFGVVYLIAGPPKLGRRIVQLLEAGLAMLVASGWWVAIVELIPARDRPYVGGSQNNSELNLIFGYNGLGRLTGNEAGSVTGGGAGIARASIWGPTGWDRLFLPSMGGQISWLIPAALVLFAGGLWLRRRAPRNDRSRAALLLWGLWLIVSGAVFSFGQGIIHPYYTIALAPAVAALIALGGVIAWRERASGVARITMATAVAGTAVWSFVLLERTPAWLPTLRLAVLVVGLAAAVGILASPLLRRLPERVALWRTRTAGAVVGVALIAALAGPAAYSVDTAAAAHSGAIPSAGPAGASTGPNGGPPSVGAGAGPPAVSRGGVSRGGVSRGGLPTGTRGAFPVGGPPAGSPGALPVGGLPARSPGSTGTGPGGPASGGLLDAGTPGAALVNLLKANASSYTWVAAIVGANSAAGYELATDEPVMAIGGFNGTDPTPTLAQFEGLVGDHKIHYFIAGAGSLGPGGSNSGDAAQIAQWVESHYTAETVNGTVLYDLSS